MTSTTAHDPSPIAIRDAAQIRRIERTLARCSFCVMASTSPSGRGHAAGVLFEYLDGALYVHTMRSSRKACNIAGNSQVGIVIPTRRLPVGPPFNVQFQATAQLLAMDNLEIVALLKRRALRSIRGHGALAEPDGCFIRITPGPVVHTYGIGVSLAAVIRDPLHRGPPHGMGLARMTTSGPGNRRRRQERDPWCTSSRPSTTTTPRWRSPRDARSGRSG